ncbi:Protein of unknown function [Pyronema omphalodes CBS 100304]|uniref:Uncharacterized protein n=1 Tax=Pyronema omphalodes (strain CBS 100304) TaxID=1076935 RepID=U4KYD1_PYROM|nr:Protein of unknown function [Pyronema omphalodes CBS 100304]
MSCTSVYPFRRCGKRAGCAVCCRQWILLDGTKRVLDILHFGVSLATDMERVFDLIDCIILLYP